MKECRLLMGISVECPVECTRVLVGQTLCSYKELLALLAVNRQSVVDIDPRDILRPTLHCPMGQVNKLVDHLIVYLQLHAEHLSNTKEQELKQDFIDCRRKVKELTDAAANKKSLAEAKQK